MGNVVDMIIGVLLVPWNHQNLSQRFYGSREISTIVVHRLAAFPALVGVGPLTPAQRVLIAEDLTLEGWLPDVARCCKNSGSFELCGNITQRLARFRFVDVHAELPENRIGIVGPLL